ncbi:MAG TPA: carboxymuconolactone decarboxylase family protein [Treponemataceae bacterium]|nr:carboxymuconolactone decarboxylase family protein [Treponemataceae bacterium]
MEKLSYKKKFTLAEYYKALLLVYGAIGPIKRNRKSQLVSQKTIERIMLRVTEVNGCPLCSYAHTSMALKQGFSQEEIESFLSGGDEYIVPEEAKALLFAQHYADVGGYVDKEAYKVFIEAYGEEKSDIILSAIKIIMVGNMIGSPMGALGSRFKGKAFKDSSIFYELFMSVSILILFPLTAIHAIFYRKKIRFSKKR